MSIHIVLILVIASLFDPIYSRALKAGSENSSKPKVSSLNAERRGGGEFFDPNGFSLGQQGHGYKRLGPAPSASLVRPMGRYRYGYFDRQARAMVKVEVEPMILGRTEHADSGYGTISSPVYAYAPGYGPGYGPSEYASSGSGTYGGTYGTSYTVQDTNPYGYQDTAASEYIVSGSSDPYGMYGDQGYAYQGGVGTAYGDVSYPGTYDSSMQSTDMQPSGYTADHGDVNYDDGSSQQLTVSGADPSQSGSGSSGGTGSGTHSGSSSSSSSSSSYRNNNGTNKRNGSQVNNDETRPSRTF